MLGSVLPSAVAWAEEFGDFAPVELFPEERAWVRDAVPRRVREFGTVRDCARRSMGKLGVAPVPILPGTRGEPRWPPGIVGSMTHCEGFRAAAVARSGDIASLGIDAEPDSPLSEVLLPKVARPEERSRITELERSDPTVHWDRLTFSAKESVYKAWFPLARCRLGFLDVSLSFNPLARTFRARLYATGLFHEGKPVSTVTGNWISETGLMCTAVVIQTEVDVRYAASSRF
ncbi:4'-phosphopantetheinyl transferase superfamily protein [Streptomyces laculatispora]|uniref:4'-phosphopantetheinyl transferase superfamily protein n=1 Tax=Streptomyces laculatispora TaxID=887464 RepID=A0ABY9I1R2_9ACTN|nr:4'-phosphopantetheinyl transferase superfamily protein [Streptomyces laculatispora]WLQ40108.1 4'-phosphopantetheinyl transferase superfamily protein [Streptomyces laculatispora]